MAQQNWWEQDAVADVPVTTVPLGPRDPLRARADARAEDAAARAAAAAERAAANEAARIELARRADARAEESARREAAKATGGTRKPMRQGDADKLESQLSAYSYLKSSVESFDDKFAGNTITGGLENTAQRALGVGTPGQADWWANFKTADNIIRNELFGASLTAGEKAAYAETTIDPSMDPKIIRQNLQRRAEIAKDILSRRVNRLRTVYNPEEVDAALGDFKPELAPGAAENEPKDRREVATGATRMEIVRGPIEKQIATMLRNGTPAKEIKRFVQENAPGTKGIDAALAYRALHPEFKGPWDVGQERVVPTTLTNRILASPLATIATQAANAATAGTLDEIGGAARSLVTGEPLDQTIASANLNKQMQADANPKSALAGNVIGGAAAMIGGGSLANALMRAGAKGGPARNLIAWGIRNPAKSAVAGDALYGAGYGAGEMNDDRLAGAGLGTAAGLAGGALGATASKAIGGTMRGVVDPAIERLRAQGIPLTAGEVLGGGWKKAQDASTSVWGPGNLMARRYGEGREAMNKAAFNEAGAIIDTPINAVGQPAIKALDEAKSQAYSAALNPVELDLSDPQFKADLDAIGAQAAKLPNDDNARQAAIDAIVYRVENNVDPGTVNMSGRGFQQAYRGLARAPKERGPKAYAEEFRQIIRGGQDALAGTLERQNPGAYEAFLKANKAHRYQMTLVDALKAAKGQVDSGDPLFTPAQLGTAATNTTANLSGKMAAVSGGRPFDQLVNDTQRVMSQKTADSGTAGRLMMGGAMVGSGSIGYGSDGAQGAVTGAAAPLALASLMNTKAGQALLVKALIARSPKLQAAGTAIRNNPQVGADLLAAAGIPLLVSQ